MGHNYLDLAPANHEAHHATVAALCGLVLHQASIDSGMLSARDLAGLVEVSGRISRRGLKCRLAAIIAPWLSEDRLWDYPPRRDAGGDETAAAIVCDLLDLSPGEYALVMHATAELLATAAYRAAHTAVAGELLREGSLSGDRILQIVSEAAEPTGPSPFQRSAIITAP